LQQLARTGLIESIRGIKGGFRMQGDPAGITMMDAVQIFEPPTLIEGCMLLDQGERCENHETCRIGHAVREVQRQAQETLRSVSIASLIQENSRSSESAPPNRAPQAPQV
jgi:Rrf2 family protein